MLMIACLLSLAAMCGCRTAPTPEDKAEQYRKAAEQGNTEAQLYLGSCYFYGDGVAQDKAEAVKWWLKAAQQGLPEAQYDLAIAYNKGVGVKEDPAKAKKWLQKAAAQKYEPAVELLKKIEADEK